MRWIFRLALFLLLLPVHAYAADINVATSTYCPLTCDLAKAPHDGIMHEVLRRAFEGTEYRLVFHQMPYVRAVRDTLDGLYDAITYVGSIHAGDFTFVRNMDMINVVQFATRADSTWHYRGISSLDAIRLSIPKGFRTGNPEVDGYLDAHEGDPSRIRMNSCDNPTMAQCANLECLLKGRVDAMLVGSLAFRYITMEEGVAGLVRVDPEPVAMFYNRIAFSPYCPEGIRLRDMMERKIREMRASGELRVIFDHYGFSP